MQQISKHMYEGATQVYKMGFNIIPLAQKGKIPVIKDVIHYRANPANEDEINQWWEKFPDANIGILTEDLVVIDADSPESTEWCLKHLKPLYMVKTCRGLHCYFKSNPKLDIRCSVGSNKIDVRAKGGYVVAEGSIHESGNVYQHYGEVNIHHMEELTMIDSETWMQIQNFMRGGESSKEDVFEPKPNLPMIQRTLLHPKAGFHMTLVRLVGSWFAEGLDIEVVRLLATTWNSESDHPMEMKRVNSIVDSIAKADKKSKKIKPQILTDIELIEELNKKYGVLLQGQNIQFIEKKINPKYPNQKFIEFYKRNDFFTLLANQNNKIIFSDSVKTVNHAKFFLEHPQRKEFHDIKFDPTESENENVLNLWGGLNVDPEKVKNADPEGCRLMLKHIFEVLADGDLKTDNYILNWCAHLVQYPERKTGVALVLHSKAQGTGKSTFVKLFSEIFGRHAITISNPEHLIGKFNNHLQDKILIRVEEACWAGNKEAQNQLKSMITDEEYLVEPKGKNAYSVESFSRLIFCSNENWVVPAEVDDRRYQGMEVSTKYANDRSYFNALHNEWNNGGKESFVQFLKGFAGAGDFDFVGERVLTDFMLEQRQLTAPTVYKWLLEFLNEQQIKGDSSEQVYAFDTQGLTVHSSIVFEDYMNFCKLLGQKHRETKQQFSKNLRLLIPFERVTIKKETYWEFPALADCRNALESILGGKIEWVEDVNSNKPDDSSPFDFDVD